MVPMVCKYRNANDTNGNVNGTNSNTISTIGKPMVRLVSQWYHRLPVVPLVKSPMVGEPQTEPLYVILELATL